MYKMTIEEMCDYLSSHKAYKKEDDLYYEKEMMESKKTIPVGELVKRFIEVDKEFKGEPWNILQILANINIIVPVEDR